MDVTTHSSAAVVAAIAFSPGNDTFTLDIKNDIPTASIKAFNNAAALSFNLRSASLPMATGTTEAAAPRWNNSLAEQASAHAQIISNAHFIELTLLSFHALVLVSASITNGSLDELAIAALDALQRVMIAAKASFLSCHLGLSSLA
jgi:hypothetical protein